MRNRAKCKVCEEVIESFHRHDYVECKCGEISVDGGTTYFRCSAKDFDNFIRVDDEDREIPVRVVGDEKEIIEKDENDSEFTKPSQILDEMIKSYENLPQHAMLQPATNADVLSILLIFQRLYLRP